VPSDRLMVREAVMLAVIRVGISLSIFITHFVFNSSCIAEYNEF
jgi:hypothetical protein